MIILRGYDFEDFLKPAGATLSRDFITRLLQKGIITEKGALSLLEMRG